MDDFEKLKKSTRDIDLESEEYEQLREKLIADTEEEISNGEFSKEELVGLTVDQRFIGLKMMDTIDMMQETIATISLGLIVFGLAVMIQAGLQDAIDWGIVATGGIGFLMGMSGMRCVPEPIGTLVSGFRR